MTFGKKVIAERKKRNWNQTDLGDTIGISRDVLGKIERGAMKPTTDIAEKIADAFNCSLDYLIRDSITDPTNLPISPKLLKQLSNLERLPNIDQEHIIAVIEAFTAKANIPPGENK